MSGKATAVLLLASGLLAGGLAVPAAGAPPGPPKAWATVPAAGSLRFEEVAEKAGARLLHRTRKYSGPYGDVLGMFTSGGAAAAAGDYDNDGRDDLFVTESDAGRPNHLLHNEGPGPDGLPRFREVTDRAGVAGGNDPLSIVSDAVWFDADGDGREDLLVVRFGTPLLYRNRGDGTFSDESASSGLDQFANTIAAVAFDYDRDGRVDLLFGNYFKPVNLIELKDRHVLPNNLDQADNGGGVTLWRNVGVGGTGGAGGGRGNGPGKGSAKAPVQGKAASWVRFEDATRAAGLAGHTGWTLDVGHADLDNDGWQDLYLAGDYGTDRLFMNRRDGTFADVTEKAIGIDTRKGMNVDMADYDRDGWLDVYVTNITDEYMKECNMLWHSNGLDAAGQLSFTDLSRETGTCATLWGWAAKWADLDNDGWEDLFVVNGLRSAGQENYIPVLLEMIIRPGVDFTDVASWPAIGGRSWSGYQKKKLYKNLGEQVFHEMSAEAGVDNDRDGRGIAVADFDGDGRLDLYQTNADQPSLLYMNRTAGTGHWVGLRLEGTGGNRDAIGARATLQAGGVRQMREVNGGNGYSSQSTKMLHFGLGAAAKVNSLEVRWPDGKVESFAVPVDRVTSLRQGTGKAVR